MQLGQIACSIVAYEFCLRASLPFFCHMPHHYFSLRSYQAVPIFAERLASSNEVSQHGMEVCYDYLLLSGKERQMCCLCNLS